MPPQTDGLAAFGATLGDSKAAALSRELLSDNPTLEADVDGERHAAQGTLFFLEPALAAMRAGRSTELGDGQLRWHQPFGRRA
jgi:hypothetical protein